MKECVICNTEFEAKGKGSHKRNTCSDECKRLQNNKKAREWRNAPKGSAYVKQHRKEYAEQSKLNQRKYREENREEFNKNHREYVAHKRATDSEFDEQFRTKQRHYMRKRQKEDKHFTFIMRFKSLMVEYLKKRGINKEELIFDLLDYTQEQLLKHFESLFTDDMSWDNYGKWHIDHIRPNSSFNYDSTEHPDFKKCWALNNLQPLWARDNMSKGKKWDGIINA
jgi:hypothetical protein